MNRPVFSTELTSAPASPLRLAGQKVLDLFSSVWLGVLLAALLFVYCSIGSAFPAVRQHPALEMTEFEWFHWWPFNLLVILFCTSLIVATVRRIPLRRINLGVWMIHGGIIVLCIGSYYYFGTKVEGDAPVLRRRVVMEPPGASGPVTMPALPGNRTAVRVGADEWRFQVQSTNSEWPILSEAHRGETAYAVNVLVQPPRGDPFVRQLLAGYPQYTEDVLPGEGRAIRTLGRKLVDEQLSITLDYEPQEYFHVMDTWALYVRRVGETQWKQRPIRNLPRYHERIGSREQVFVDPHHVFPLRAIDLPVPPAEGGDALDSASVRITGYLRYAQMKQRWRDGGPQLNPVLRGSLLTGHAPAQNFELAAFDRLRDRSETGLVEFRWLDDFALADQLPTDARPRLTIAVPEADVSIDLPIDEQTVVGPEGAFTPLDGTDFAYRVVNVHNNLVLPGHGRSISIAMVDVRTPDGQFTRMVADDPERTRDMHGPSADPHAAPGRHPELPDPRIVMSYRPESAPIIFAAHPRGLFLVVNGPDGRMLGRDVDVGESVEIVPGLSIRADALWPHAVAEIRPYVVPPPARQRDAGENFAMIRLEIQSGHDAQARWVPFCRYAFPNEQYAYGGRFAYSPQRFRLPDGTRVEVLFSRQRRPLPAPVALEDFTLDTHIGGYTGQPLTIRNYVSRLRFFLGDPRSRRSDSSQWTDPVSIQVNAPAEFGGYWYFQSMWDKPPADDPSAGMNYTGLGVGNRNGVWIQLAGCCLSVAGMIFAFYVKPVLLRRRRGAAYRAGEEKFAPESLQRNGNGAGVDRAEPAGVGAEA